MLPDAKTKLFALIGSPIDHSFSPSMHNTSFEEKDINGCYLAFDTDEETLEDVVKSLKSLNAIGWNVTMPVKTKMAELCDELSEEAQIIGAVNTVVNQDGHLKGYSTDGIGFFRNAKENGVDVKDSSIVLVGAGGAARSIAAQAILEDVKKLTIYNRTFSKAQKLAEDLNKYTENKDIEIIAKDLSDAISLKADIDESDIFINATSVGMNPINNDSIIDPNWLREDLVVADIVYTPVKTKLEEEALKKRCKVLDGMGMVLWQGAYSFNYWTGEEFPVDLVKKKVFNID